MERSTPRHYWRGCVCTLICASAVQAQPYRFALFELDPISVEGNTHARGINNSGIVVGASNAADEHFNPTLWMNTSAIDLGTFGGAYGIAWDINNSGDVAGWATEPGGGFLDERAALWRNGEINYLGSLGGEVSVALGINEASEIVGWSELEPPEIAPWRAFHWQDEVITDLGALSGGASEAHDITDSGDIVGRATTTSEWRPVLWQDELIIDLGTLRSDNIGQGNAYEVNEAGQVVGWANDEAFRARAFLWENGAMRGLGDFRRDNFAFSINEIGEVVGFGSTSGGVNTAFFWSERAGMRNLETLIPPRSGVRLEVAEQINDYSQIATWGFRLGDPPNTSRGFLLSPVTPEFTLAEPSPGLANQVNTITATGLAPGVRVYFIYGKRGGGTEVPNCDILDAVLQICDARIAGSGVTDSNGTATLEMFVPAIARNLGDILIQAVAPSVCQESQLVVTLFD